MVHVRCMEYSCFENACPVREEPRKDWQSEWNVRLEKAAVCHPKLMSVVALLGLPAAVVAGVFLATGVVMLPLSMLLGWV